MAYLSRRLGGMPAFRRLLASLAVSSLGDWMYNVALLAFVYERTSSPTWLALTTAAASPDDLVLALAARRRFEVAK